jgi:hypothetical protein
MSNINTAKVSTTFNRIEELQQEAREHLDKLNAIYQDIADITSGTVIR